ncbi:MAG: FkbM family methyltransferase, partial [Bacteroidota bacterium]
MDIRKYWEYSHELGRLMDWKMSRASLNYFLFKRLPQSSLRVNNPQMGQFHCRENTTDFMYSLFSYEYRLKQKLLAHTQEYTTFLDIGACIGDYSILMANQGLEVFSFEPQPENYQALRANLRLNCLQRSVDTFHCGLGAQPDEVTFRSHPYNRGYSGKYVDHPEGTDFPVQIKTLDQIWVSLGKGIHQSVMVKLDVEGMEEEILEGGGSFFTSVRKIMLVFEAHTTQEAV